MSTSTVSQVSGAGGSSGTQYAVKKRRRPQAKKDKNTEKDVTKSNPSKRHRDRLNSELDHLAKLIPFPEEVLNKLDKLSILRLAVAYLRNKNYNAGSNGERENELGQLVAQNPHTEVACFKESESKLSLMALHGFLLVVTQDFNIFYVSESVQDYLGFPQCDVMNLSMLDLIHAEDRDLFIRHMQLNPQQTPNPPPEEGDPPTAPDYAKYGMTSEVFQEISQDGLLHRSFICRLRCLLDNSSGFLALHFTGHLRIVPGQNKKGEGKANLPPETGLFLLASPLQSPSILEIRTKNFIFRTKHRLDYTPLGIDAKGKIVLGYTDQQLRQRSGYEFVHSADMMHCADAHTKLMRKGESGLTVFRLLHKDNKWIWVTASARLIFRNGQPDYIIATQRPILDQEGEDHMKKRTNAFRFDFTGQAVLYGEVNPIGVKGGPENNTLDEHMQEEGPSSKRSRITNNSDMEQSSNVDRATLYGAQSMQRMDIYVGNLPNQSSEIYTNSVSASAGAIEEMIKSEQIDNDVGPLTNDSDIYFYPMGTETASQQQSPVAAMGQQYQAHGNTSYQPGPLNQPVHMNINNGQNPNNTLANQQQCLNNNIGSYPQTHMPKQEPPRLHHPPADTRNFPIDGGNPFPQHGQQRIHQDNPLKRPHPSSTKLDVTQQRMEQWGQQRVMETSSSIGKSMQTIHNAMAKSESVVSPQQLPFPNYNHDMNAQNPAQSTLRFAQAGGSHFPSPGHAPKNSCNQQTQMELNVQPVQNFNRQQPPPSVMKSMTINSVLTGHNMERMTQTTDGANNTHYSINNEVLPPPQNWNEPQLIGCQDNMIQFDLNKIASDYQTTDPVSKVKNYLHDNPSHAMAIATGLMPEDGMPKLASNKVEAYMSSCQFQQPHPVVEANHQYMGSATSIGKNITNSPYMNYDSMLSDNGSSYMASSVTSNKSMSTASLTDHDSPGSYVNEQGYQ